MTSNDNRLSLIEAPMDVVFLSDWVKEIERVNHRFQIQQKYIHEHQEMLKTRHAVLNLGFAALSQY